MRAEAAAGNAGSPARHRGRPRPATALPRLLPPVPGTGPVSLGDHLAGYGPLPRWRADGAWRARLIAEVDRARLAGRGGAGFPAAIKLAALARARGAVVVANGTEGEPASAKDKVLMARSPHLVLDGVVAAAELTGAREAVVVAHPAVTEVVAQAAGERRRARLDRIRIQVLPAAGTFVAGEASAVVRWIEQGVPVPAWRPVRLAERGLRGRPTLVSNVETLAHLALIVRYGADWFAGVGTAGEPGSMLVTLAGAVRRPGVYEIAIGTPVAQVLAAGGGPAAPLGALLIGGYFGTWVDARQAAGRPFSREGLAGLGAGVGAGLIAALPAGACGLEQTARLARYLAGQSAGQCGPCVLGLDAIAGELAALAAGTGPDLGRLRRWIGQVGAGRGACKHPDGTVTMIASALELFRDEVAEHMAGWCTGTGGAAALLPVPGAVPGGAA